MGLFADIHWTSFYVDVAPVVVGLMLGDVAQNHCRVGVAVVAVWAQLEVDEGLRVDEPCLLGVVENLGSVQVLELE